MPSLEKDDCIFLNREHIIPITIIENANDKNEKPQEKYIRRERYVGEMQRSFYIDDIDEKNIKASYQDGILTVVLPKATKEKNSCHK